ncbi:triacylglycerol lipase [Coprinopsis cinerea okayama7|uniref:Carboxylic ester hydrolase n=1 Tax=Coprinopsis cinerea (strain Okayama-7 / 130 / ATCC MYA-4618 / FGSC 9003) TaxID=240176 RepID=A8P0V0_COPC7|nr:triacylglycerol lipase [Coprinopsis cinerea okayama7\|eukprot:XP_001837971.2 triacylglycerol lipase [Coprinopsis cinerea okayama7\
MSDDCLTLNIHRPSGVKPNARLPVLFWSYGGAWSWGASSTYNGSTLVSRSIERGTPVIYVNFNYRLGPFGWPQGQESEDQGVLNLGLHDHIAALQWVQHNIHHFGGDRNKVTIFGESAGSISNGILYLNSGLERLARGAIFQSGQANSVINPKASYREDVWQRLIRAMPSCAATSESGSSIPCLREASSVEILTAWLQIFQEIQDFILFLPTIDPARGSLLPDYPSRLYSQGRFARIPFISGTNLDEGTAFANSNPNATEDNIKGHIIGYNSPSPDEKGLARVVDELFDVYPDVPSLGSPFNTGDELFGLSRSYKRHAAILTDMVFEAPRRMWLEAATSRGVKAWSYLFKQPQPLDNPAWGVYHSSEIEFVYGQPRDQSPSARNVSTLMMDYWISFAVNLDPNDRRGLRRPTWPRYTKRDGTSLQLQGGNTTAITDNFRVQKSRFFNSHPILFRH